MPVVSTEVLWSLPWVVQCLAMKKTSVFKEKAHLILLQIEAHLENAPSCSGRSGLSGHSSFVLFFFFAGNQLLSCLGRPACGSGDLQHRIS